MDEGGTRGRQGAGGLTNMSKKLKTRLFSFGSAHPTKRKSCKYTCFRSDLIEYFGLRLLNRSHVCLSAVVSLYALGEGLGALEVVKWFEGKKKKILLRKDGRGLKNKQKK